MSLCHLYIFGGYCLTEFIDKSNLNGYVNIKIYRVYASFVSY